MFTSPVKLIAQLATYILVAHPNHEVASLKVDFGDPWPIVMSHRRFVAKHDDATRREAQKVLDAVFALELRESRGKQIKLTFRQSAPRHFTSWTKAPLDGKLISASSAFVLVFFLIKLRLSAT